MMKCLLLYPGKNWKLAERLLFFLIRCYCKSLLLKWVEIGDSPASMLSFPRAVDESIVHCWPVELTCVSRSRLGWLCRKPLSQTTLLPWSNCSSKLITVEWSSKVWRGTCWPKTSHSTPVTSLNGFHPCPRVACSAGVFFGRVNVFARESAWLLFLLSPIFLCHKIKDGGNNNTNMNKLSPTQNTPGLQASPRPHYIMSGHLSGADWKEILRSAHHCTVVGREVSPVRVASQTLDEERDCLDWRRCQHQLARTL